MPQVTRMHNFFQNGLFVGEHLIIVVSMELCLQDIQSIEKWDHERQFKFLFSTDKAIKNTNIISRVLIVYYQGLCGPKVRLIHYWPMEIIVSSKPVLCVQF